MKSQRIKNIVIASFVVLATTAMGVVETTSESFVGVASVIKGSGGNGSRVSCFSLPIVNPVTAAGTITSIGTNDFRDTNANWAADAFVNRHGSYYVEFDCGLMMEIVTSDATAKTITLGGDIRELTSVGARYRVREHFTVGEIFSSENIAGIKTGLNDAAADNVMLYLPETQSTLTLFCFSLSNAWYTSQYQPAGNLTLYPEQGIFVRRKGTNDLVLYAHGLAKEGATKVPVYQGMNLIGTLKGARSVRLADLNLYTGNTNTGFAEGVNMQVADNLRLVNEDGSTSTYFYFPGYGWVDSTYNGANDVVVEPGAAFFLIRKSPRSAFFWSIPAD
jgi:hypothetical protein